MYYVYIFFRTKQTLRRQETLLQTQVYAIVIVKFVISYRFLQSSEWKIATITPITTITTITTTKTAILTTRQQ